MTMKIIKNLNFKKKNKVRKTSVFIYSDYKLVLKDEIQRFICKDQVIITEKWDYFIRVETSLFVVY